MGGGGAGRGVHHATTGRADTPCRALESSGRSRGAAQAWLDCGSRLLGTPALGPGERGGGGGAPWLTVPGPPQWEPAAVDFPTKKGCEIQRCRMPRLMTLGHKILFWLRPR